MLLIECRMKNYAHAETERMRPSPGDPFEGPFSIECVIIGRNDDYEPNWVAKLEAAIAWNRGLFEGTPVDFRVAFVEWNPPRGKARLSPGLVRKFPYLRAIAVEPEIHEELCEVPDLQIMLNYSFNAAMRTTEADYVLITGGDDFIGSELAREVIDGGLQPGCLYRAERVNVRRDFPFTSPELDRIEQAENIVSVDTCTEPPFDKPPYTNASGDFLLLDSGTMAGIRGLDEGIKNARLHIDSRFCATAMVVVDDCRLLGRIFHIDHGSSYNNKRNVPGKFYQWDAGLPYLNSAGWGLAKYRWEPGGERLYRVSVERATESSSIPRHLSAPALERASAISQRLIAVRRSVQPDEPTQGLYSSRDVDLSGIITYGHWESKITALGGGLQLETGPVQWGYAAMLPLDVSLSLSPDRWHWLVVTLSVSEGRVGVGLLKGESTIEGENFVGDRSSELIIPINDDSQMITFRNVADSGTRSIATIDSVKVVSQEKDDPDETKGELLRS
jgi:hypothetical protein